MLGGLPVTEEWIDESMEIIAIKPVATFSGRAWYPIAGEIREYVIDPAWEGLPFTIADLIAGKRPEEGSSKRVVAKTHTLSVENIEGDRPMDPEVFLLRFP